MVCGIMPRALLHGRGAGARSRSPLARQGAGSRVLEVALERVLRALVAFFPAAAASAAAGYSRVRTYVRRECLWWCSAATAASFSLHSLMKVDLGLQTARFGQLGARSVHI